MKVLILCMCVVVTALGAQLSSPQFETPYQQNEEMDEFTAAMREATDAAVFDDEEEGDDDDEDMTTDVAAAAELTDDQDKVDGDVTENEILYANVTDDGMIQIEDMVVSPDMFGVMFPHLADHSENTASVSIHRRAAVSSSSKFWPSGRVYYAYTSNLYGSTSKIKAAMAEWEKYTCVKFYYRKSGSSKYTQFRNSDGKCSSTLGYTGRLQHINLGKNCYAHRTLLHEIGHTLGLIHEHQHPLRDRYVTINWSNINPVKTSNFKTKTGISSWGIPYDPLSIMHYWATAFKKSGCKSNPCYTMQSKQGSSQTRLIGTAKHLSKKSDIPIINKIYKCPSSG